MMGRGHGGESKINVASTTFVPGHRTPQLLWLSGFADTRKLQTWPGSTPRGQQIRMVSAKVQVQWQHRRTEKLYHQWNIRCRPASAEDLSNGNWFRFERGRRGRRGLNPRGSWQQQLVCLGIRSIATRSARFYANKLRPFMSIKGHKPHVLFRPVSKRLTHCSHL